MIKQINIENLMHLFTDSMGLEAAEKIVYEAIESAGLSKKSSYIEEEHSKICEELKKRGGFIKTIARVASTAEYSAFYYEKELAEERRKKEDLARLNSMLEQKVEERTRQLKEAESQLVQSAKMSAVGLLGAGVAHEMNNPLCGILGYAQFILEKFKRPDFSIENLKACQKYIESIERESTRCRKIVENLLKFSRMPIVTKPEVADITSAIEETLSLTRYYLKTKNVNVVLDLKPSLVKVLGVINHLQQVFTNIILNAQESMPDGGELKISAENLAEDEATQAPKGVKIEFTDTGCGIPEEILPRIFEPFFTTKQNEKGTGLGLSVSYQIIQEHKGTIQVESQVGKGTTFIITLPATTGK